MSHGGARSFLTEEQGLVGVSMNETLNGGIGGLMQRIQLQRRVVWKYDRLQRKELTENWIVSGVCPIDSTQDVRTMVCFVSFVLQSLIWAVATHVNRIDMVTTSTPCNTSSMKASFFCMALPWPSRGTSSGMTACRNLKSLGLPSTVLVICIVLVNYH